MAAAPDFRNISNSDLARWLATGKAPQAPYGRRAAARARAVERRQRRQAYMDGASRGTPFPVPEGVASLDAKSPVRVRRPRPTGAGESSRAS